MSSRSPAFSPASPRLRAVAEAASDRPPGMRAALGRWLLLAAMLLGGAAYVFRHDLLPADHAAPVETPARPMTVTVVTAERRAIARSIVAAGTLVGREEVLVGARIDGVPVARLLAEAGDRVTEGQPLALLDGDRIALLLAQKSADRAQAEAAVAQAQARLTEAAAGETEAGLALERAAALRAKDSVSAQALEAREAGAAAAAARTEAQRQEMAAARAALARVAAEQDELMWERDQTTVRAPAAGVVVERAARLGQTTAGDGAPLFRILADGAVEMEAAVIETALPAIRPGQPASVAIAGIAAPVRGEVRLVAPAIDPATRMGKVRIALPGVAATPGASAVATLEAERREGIVLPRAAVLAGDAGPRVQLVEDGAVILRPVETGLTDAEGVEIRAGLEGGETVVAAAGGFLREGSQVSSVRLRVAEEAR